MKLQGQNQDEQFESALKKLENEFNELKKKINQMKKPEKKLI